MQYEQAQKNFLKAQDEIEILRNKVKMLTPIDDEEISPAFKTNSDLHRKIELLENEKMYLTKENIKYSEVNKRLEDKSVELEQDLAESKRTVQKYLQELLDTK